MEIEIRDLWKIIYQKVFLISMIVVVSVLVTGFVSYYMLTPKYEALTTLIVKDKSSENGMAYDDLIASEKLLKTYSEMVKSNSVAEEVITKLNLTATPEKLLEKLRVQGSNESLITSIIIVDEDPSDAVAIANEFASTSLAKWKSVMDMDNVYVLDKAKLAADPKPVYPKPIIYMILSFFLSLIIGIVVAILIEFLDRTLKTEAHIEQLLTLPVLGVIPNTASKEKKKMKLGIRKGGKQQGENTK